MTAAADKAAAGRAARAKGQRGERQVAALIADATGWTIKRRVRQHAGDSDLEGVPGWCVEVKCHARPSRGAVAHWWEQTVAQTPCGSLPVLFFKAQPGDWRAVWPLDMVGDQWWHKDYAYTVEGSVDAWAHVACEYEASRSTLLEQNPRSNASIVEQEAS